MPTILITGGTGLIGTAVSKMLLSNGYDVIILTRSSSLKLSNYSFEASVSCAQWNVEKGTIDAGAIAKADYIIHLAGANVGEKRWTEKRKKEIVESRVKSGALIVKALREMPNKVSGIISASAIGWYGDEGVNRSFFKAGSYKEDMPAASDFLGQTCKQWEESIQPVTVLGKRLIILRTGIVLSNDGGALPEFKKTLRFGVAAILGSGKQIISWIHVEDLCRMYIHALEKNIQGVFNAVAPHPVSNKTLTTQLAKQVRGKLFVRVPVPAFVLKIVLGEMSVEVLKSSTVSSEKIQSTGFKFLYPSIEEALKSL